MTRGEYQELRAKLITELLASWTYGVANRPEKDGFILINNYYEQASRIVDQMLKGM